MNDPRANDDEFLPTAAAPALLRTTTTDEWGEIRFEAVCTPARPRMGRVAVLVRLSMVA